MAKKIVLQEDDIPRNYYNIVADLPFEPHPPLDPETREPMGPEKMAVIFPMNLLEQEMSGDVEIPIPEAVLNAYINYRPSPLVRAT
ncbi:MAG TPA: TrpB-like pyridoxal-phosphate dependent enzyme, partial [bacterium]|nr:TrpB-like pyridoxal-phosphate dependent enzyme [bacterium]